MCQLLIDPKLRHALQTLGVVELRPHQLGAFISIDRGHDILALLPTDSGKSLLFQLPALLDPPGALTLVISPLRALQDDQVTKLQAHSISTVLLNSDLSEFQHAEILSAFTQTGGILYTTPEQLCRDDVRNALQCSSLRRVVLDEVHVIAETSDHFRAAYMDLGSFIEAFPQAQRIALTATATKQTRKRIIRRFQLRDPDIFAVPMRRNNLHLHVKKIASSAKSLHLTANNLLYRGVENELTEWWEKRSGSAIIYCATVAETQTLAAWLKSKNWKALCFHGELSQKKRKRVLNKFKTKDRSLVVATTAFGLGIDKPNVRLVIHAGLPLTMDDYVQQIGRAGRDGKKSRCVLFYRPEDFARNKQILLHGASEPERQSGYLINRLDALRDIVSANCCLWKIIEKYFGEYPHKSCKHCCVCKRHL